MKTSQPFVRYQDTFCTYIRKPAGIPSTFGKEKSFLELIFEDADPTLHTFVARQRSIFWEQEEFWLLNRLDNATSGLLYFAKSPAIKEDYKTLQKLGKLRKTYLLEVYGDLRYWTEKNGFLITFPLAHHKFEKERMVVITSDHLLKKCEPRLHQVQTKILEQEWNAARQTTTLLVEIQKWIRHQIRSHLSAIGYPIVWDELYWKKKDPKKGNLQLFSVGLACE